MKRSFRLVTVVCALFAASVALAQGVPGADGKNTMPDRDAMKSRTQERCKANPQRCEEMKARREKRREACKADPEKCRAEMKARFEERCKANPQRCEEMKARMKERQEQCKADPLKCPPAQSPQSPGK
jgi:hypothetical protein